MNELAPHIRVLCYIIGTWLAARGVPPEIASYISSDPAFAVAFSQAVGVVMGAAAYVFWRIAKRLGWST